MQEIAQTEFCHNGWVEHVRARLSWEQEPAIEQHKREFMNEKLLEKVIKKNGSVPCIDAINDNSIAVVEAT